MVNNGENIGKTLQQLGSINTVKKMIQTKKRALFIRFFRGYLSRIAMILFVLAISLVKGAGWEIVLVGMPLFLTYFVGITYQLIKELRTLK